jgi:hypothetical protein
MPRSPAAKRYANRRKAVVPVGLWIAESKDAISRILWILATAV